MGSWGAFALQQLLDGTSFLPPLHYRDVSSAGVVYDEQVGREEGLGFCRLCTPRFGLALDDLRDILTGLIWKGTWWGDLLVVQAFGESITAVYPGNYTFIAAAWMIT